MPTIRWTRIDPCGFIKAAEERRKMNISSPEIELDKPQGWYCNGKMHLVETTNDISHKCWHRPGPDCNKDCASRCQGCANYWRGDNEAILKESENVMDAHPEILKPVPHEVKPTKVLDYKTYNSIPHLSKSRLGESDSTIDMKSELKMTQELPNKNCKVIIQEKMDGSNVCVVRFQGELKALSRSGYDCSNSNQEQHRMFYRWVQKHKDAFDKLLPNEHDRVVGEWMALAHGTIYKDLKIPFYVFDLYRNKVQVSHATLIDAIMRVSGLPTFCMYPRYEDFFEPVSIDDAIAWVNEHRPDAEGVIYRLENKGNPYMIAKVVKMDKVDGKYLKVEDTKYYIWNWKE